MAMEAIVVQKIQEVSALLAVPNSRIIAGGTTFSGEGLSDLHPVDISGLESLIGMKQKGTRIEIGPLTTLSAMAESPLLKTYSPALAEACAAAATPEIRNTGTLGGNLCAEKIGDTAVALLASGAKLTIKTDSDYRDILIDRFWAQDGSNDLQYDEWITKISVQMPKERRWGAAFGKIGEWNLVSDPVAAAAVRLSLNEDDEVETIRGGLRIGTKNIRRMFPLEKALKNLPLTDENIAKAASSMSAAAQNQEEAAELTALLTEVLQRCRSMAAERRTP